MDLPAKEKLSRGKRRYLLYSLFIELIEFLKQDEIIINDIIKIPLSKTKSLEMFKSGYILKIYIIDVTNDNEISVAHFDDRDNTVTIYGSGYILNSDITFFKKILNIVSYNEDMVRCLIDLIRISVI